NQMLAASFGNMAVIALILCMGVLGVAMQTGAFEWLVQVILNNKFMNGKAWFTLWFILLFAWFMGSHNPIIMCVIFCAFANAIFKQVGLEKNDPLIVAMYLGIAYCLMMGQILFPFISTGLTLVMAYGAMFPNNPIDFVPYLIYMIIVGIAMVTVYTALMKFVFRIDASKIANFKTEGGAPKATREQKIGLILFVIFILLMLGHSLPLGPVKHFLEKFGLIGIVLLMSCVVALMKKSDGTPLIDLERAFHMCNWGQVTMVGYIMVCSQYMMGADAGISAAMAKLIMPFMALPPIVFLVVALAIGVILTNVANNMIVCILLMPFLVNFGSMIGMPPTGMVALLFFMSQFAIATPAASPVTAVAMTQEMADPGVMTKFALKIIPFLFIFGIAIGWPVANIVF
ncbi:MAG: hypothetical protein IIW67_04925, partial [Peptococcaceae bacterium]|nr:hypothetical protein [Peptococcaceae bacterium]